MRFTPPSKYVAIIASVTSSGLHSIVTSAPGTSGNSLRQAISATGGTSVGVPPPTNTVSTDGMPAATLRRMSVTSAFMYWSMTWWRSVHVANEQ